MGHTFKCRTLPVSVIPGHVEEHRSLPRHENPNPGQATVGVKSPVAEDGTTTGPSSATTSSPVGAPYSSTGTIREATAAGTREPSRRRLATKPYAPCIRERQEVAS